MVTTFPNNICHQKTLPENNLKILLLINSFITGGLIMALEMLGGRFLSIYFGNGIHSWAAIISIVMVALTVGPLLGGCLSDRWPNTRPLFFLLAPAAIYILLIPLFYQQLLEYFADSIEDFRIGAFVAAIPLLFIPTTLLGTYSPYAIKLLLQNTHKSGRTAGMVYGVSTIGSTLGIMLTTFYFIPFYGQSIITTYFGILLIITSFSFLIFHYLQARKHQGYLIAIYIAILLIFSIAFCLGFHKDIYNHPTTGKSANGPSTSTGDIHEEQNHRLLNLKDGVIEHIESEYNNIFISKKGAILTMSFEKSGVFFSESARSLLDDIQLVFIYTQLMVYSLPYAENPQKILMIGLGGGAVTNYLKRYMPELNIDIVELDPAVINAARKYFQVEENSGYNLIASDGRLFLHRNKEKKYDLIFVDAYKGGFIPFHLTTKEFYQEVKKHLVADGHVVINLHKTSELFNNFVVTVKDVFSEIDQYKSADSGNSILVGSNYSMPSLTELKGRAKKLQEKYKFFYDLNEFTGYLSPLDYNPQASVLIDDWAPTDFLNSIKKNNVY